MLPVILAISLFPTPAFNIDVRFTTSELVPDPFTSEDPTCQATIVLRKDFFIGNEEIFYYAILLASKNAMESPTSGTWNGTIWPDLRKWENSETENGTILPYQTTPAKWSPFINGSHTVKYTIGGGGCDINNFCNSPLKENFEYSLKVRTFTGRKYQDTEIVYFETLSRIPVRFVSLVLVGIFLVGASAVAFSITHFDVMCFCGLFSRTKDTARESILLHSFSPSRFLTHANDLLTNKSRLDNEFHLLGTLSSNMTTLCLHGQRIDNRDKNRYGDILPFDVTRVELSLINNDPSTDYINASFIRGYHQRIEYVAAQGPKRETCYDFYRMIVEKQIEIIVMLTDIEENGEEQCYKYYPDVDRTFQFRDIQVYCKFEKYDGFCITRTLAVRQGSVEMKVTHLQFGNWTDLKCPKNSEHFMKLLAFVRDIPHKGYVLVHGSAGAGRCGTFIALDILVQSIKNRDKISVFSTVLELRRQRMNMVHTLQQYAFIYKSVSEVILNSSGKNLVTHL